jgi:isoleucyl-tRNA synthetase
LAVENPVGGDGVFLPSTELFAGEHVFSANAHVLDVLEQKGKLLHHHALLHSYPHCWRHKTPIIFRATPQWFISMEQNGLREQALNEIKRVDWIPDWGQARIESMLEGRPDWCISRQRNWGVPIAFFIDKETGELHPQTVELIEDVAKRIEKQGIDAWFDLEPVELLGAEADRYQKITDTLDVWFDSGVTHACVLDKREALRFPADLYLEGSDQHRGWFQSSLLASVAKNGVAPYKAVLTHGFTVDAEGKKMSKSKGNVVAPQSVMKDLGADVLRLWVASTDYRGEMSVSNEILSRTSDSYRRLRNTARFLLANLNDFDPDQHKLAAQDLLALDRWVLDRAFNLQQQIISAYEAYQFQQVMQKVHHFCSIDLSSFYLDIIKDRQYTAKTDGLARRSAQTAQYHLLEALVRWLAPVTCYTADEIWSYIPGKRSESIFLETWYTGLTKLDEQTALNREFWENLMTVRAEVSKELEKSRAKGDIGSGLNAEVELYCNEHYFELLNRLGNELHFVFITSNASVISDQFSPEDALTTAINGIKIKVKVSEHTKCIRCWHHRYDVGEQMEHPELCGRCVENIDGSGEVRRYV